MKPHILIIDDEAAIRDLLAQFLANHGFRTTTVASGDEALRIVRSEPPRLIISDLQLEEEDGLETIAKLKTALPNTPVILLTGVLFDPAVVRETLSQKVSCYLPKTSSLAQILEAVRRLVG